jgi:ankyrin repeat protein
LEHGADIDWRDDRGQTPLLFALQRGYLDMARLLLDNFLPSVNQRDFRGRNAIWYAIDRGCPELVQILLNHACDIWISDVRRITPLNMCIIRKRPMVAQMLLDYSESRPLRPSLFEITAGDHPLSLAVGYGMTDMVKILISHGADVTTRDPHDRNVLHLAAERGHDEILGILLSHEKPSINDRDVKGRTPLHSAAFYGHRSTARLLLNTPGMDIDAQDHNRATALSIAAQEGHQHVGLAVLFQEPNTINSYCRSGKTPIHYAVENCLVLLVCALIEMDSLDPNVRDEQDWTVMSYAACQGDIRIFEVLLTRQDLDLNISSAPPIYLAAERGHYEIVRRLISFESVDLNQTMWHKSPLFIAIENGFRHIAKLLLLQGRRLDINIKSSLGDTAFSLAACFGYLDIVDCLLQDERLDVTSINSSGESALCLAASRGHERVVKSLCCDDRVRSCCNFERAVEAAANIRIRYLLQEPTNSHLLH